MSKLLINILCILALLLPTHSQSITDIVIPEPSYDHHHAQASRDGVFQGDIKLVEETSVHGNIRGSNANTTRSLGSGDTLKWDTWNKNGYYWIRVYIDTDHFNDNQISIIRKALLTLQYTGKVIKFKFQRNKPHASWRIPYIRVTNNENGGGCWSYHGRTEEAAKGYGQPLSLTNEYLTTSTIHHVFLHALGFAHQINRPDRDKYVAIYENNIMADKVNEFAVFQDMDTLGIPFDNKSVMMYSEHTFAKNSAMKTIVSKTNNDISPSANGATWWDYMHIRLMYQCVGDLGAESRNLDEYHAIKCTETCQCWENSGGCNKNGNIGNQGCKGSLECRNNVCKRPK